MIQKPTQTEYLFIDGAYLKQRYSAAMTKVFGEPGQLDLGAISYGRPAQKTFYYDCIDDSRREAESDKDYDLRVTKQIDEMNRWRSLEGFHVRLGSISGANRKIRQKQVDILLAVDMMNHAFRGNMQRATLIAGDLDFKPLLASLIEHGTYVRVLYDRTSVSDELRWTADGSEEIGIAEYCQWTNFRFQAEHHFPKVATHSSPDRPVGPNEMLIAALGQVNDGSITDEVQLYQECRGGQYYIVSTHAGFGGFWGRHRDRDVLHRYIESHLKCTIKWNEDRERI